LAPGSHWSETDDRYLNALTYLIWPKPAFPLSIVR